MRFEPERSGCERRINPGLAPPRGFVAVAMDITMVAAAERDGELVADLAAERAALREAQMVSVAWLPTADQTGLVSDKSHMLAVADPARFRQRQHALFDAAGSGPTLSPGLAFGLAPGLGRLGEREIEQRRRRRCRWSPRRFGCRRRKGCQLGPECLLDPQGVGCSEAVLGGKRPVRPERRIIATGQSLEPGKQSIAQVPGCLRAECGLGPP